MENIFEIVNLVHSICADGAYGVLSQIIGITIMSATLIIGTLVLIIVIIIQSNYGYRETYKVPSPKYKRFNTKESLARFVRSALLFKEPITELVVANKTAGYNGILFTWCYSRYYVNKDLEVKEITKGENRYSTGKAKLMEKLLQEKRSRRWRIRDE
jgi:hypothetical protein